ncbi:hypothetical protein AEYBE204_19160 [Asticcacaulis sp. YBE204]|nr:hypothetical protein AEYBE204_19160 [Asticcacaulis sp. YBE204]
MYLIITFLLLLFGSQPAVAEWRRAESDHFIIYGESTPRVLEAHAVRLEKFHYILHSFQGFATDIDGPKLEVYYVKDTDDIRLIVPGMGESVAGFYRLCDAGEMAIAIDFNDMRYGEGRLSDQEVSTSQIVLFHEYGHRFMFQYGQVRYPAWFVEGFAEYYSTVRMKDKEFLLGMPWIGRHSQIEAVGLPIDYTTILSGKQRDLSDDKYESYYPQAWLLTHYIMTDAPRRKAFEAYLLAINNGDDPLVAFKTHMGIDPADLNKVLKAYFFKGLTSTYYSVPEMPVFKVTVSAVPMTDRRLLLWDATAKTCASKTHKATILERIRTTTAKNTDPFSRSAQIHAEANFGDPAKAIAQLGQPAAEDADSLFWLGYAWYRVSQESDDSARTAEALKNARTYLMQAYKARPAAAATLYYLSLAQKDRPGYPNATALNAAVEAANLSAGNSAYVFHAAILLIQSDRAPEAAILLAPLASSPHGGKMTERLKKVITAINEKQSRQQILSLLSSGDELKDEDEEDEEKEKEKGKK